MARIKQPPPGKLIVSIIYSSLDALSDALNVLERKFGKIQYETLEVECEQAPLYTEEMGNKLSHRFFSFEKNISRDSLTSIKAACYKIEAQFSDNIDNYPFRTVNIDPGLLTPTTLVMASHKEESHKVYLKDGVYGEIVMIYAHGGFCRLPWTKSDYCDEETITFLDRVKATFEEPKSEQEMLNF
ncbi:MAG TPA: DUF4416 family protein [candidate division Zixibacteria bacterium]|nr:DUF4416 family protein [candidate division Zixibacteria bacterium]